MLAHALATQRDHGLRALKTGVVGQWVRRGLGDGPLAVSLEERLDFHDAASDGVSSETDTLSLMRAVGVLDPLVPMCWDGLNLWRDAIGTTLAALQDPALSGGGSSSASSPGASPIGVSPGVQSGAPTGAEQAGTRRPAYNGGGAGDLDGLARRAAQHIAGKAGTAPRARRDADAGAGEWPGAADLPGQSAAALRAPGSTGDRSRG